MERRRMQNRIAQRRFRQRQSQKKNANRAQNKTGSNSEPYYQESLSGEPRSPESFDPSSTAVVFSSDPFAVSSLDIYGTSDLLNGFMNLDDIGASDSDPPTSASSSLQAISNTTSETMEEILNEFTHHTGISTASSESVSGGCVIGSLRPASDSDRVPSGPSEAGGWLIPLHIAARKGYDRIVHILLQHHTNCDEKDSDGLTPLIYATIGGYEEVVSLLLSHGASLAIVDSQHHRSAIHWAVIHRRESLLKVLLNHCSGEQTLIDNYDIDGITPLHTAVDIGFETGVQILLQFGANVHSRARKSSYK